MRAMTERPEEQGYMNYGPSEDIRKRIDAGFFFIVEISVAVLGDNDGVMEKKCLIVCSTSKNKLTTQSELLLPS